MPLHRYKFALTPGFVFAIVATSSTVGAQPLAQDVVDARQETQVWKAYALNPHLSADASGSWISDPGQSALLHTNATRSSLTPLDRGAANKPGDEPANQARFATALERPQPLPELKGLYPDAFRF